MARSCFLAPPPGDVILVISVPVLSVTANPLPVTEPAAAILPSVSNLTLCVDPVTNCKFPPVLDARSSGLSYIFQSLPPFHRIPSLTPGSLNARLSTVGDESRLVAKDIDDLAKRFRVTKEEAFQTAKRSHPGKAVLWIKELV